MNILMEEDLISQLPDELLYRIISTLPFKSSFNTNFLSVRWRNLWKSTLVQYGSLEEFVYAIEIFVRQFEELNPLKHPRRLKYHTDQDSFVLAAIAPCKKLLLDFSQAQKESPRQYSLSLNLKDETTHPQPCSFTYYVKALHLTSIGDLTSDAVSTMVSSLQFLSSLNITNCKTLKFLSINGVEKLQQLGLANCSQLRVLSINAPELQFFRYDGPLPYFQMYSKFCLIDAALQFHDARDSRVFDNLDLLTLLESINDAKSLKLNIWTYEALLKCWLFSRRIGLLELQELSWIDYSDKNMKIDVLLSFLKFCPFLTRLAVEDEIVGLKNTGTSSKKLIIRTQLGYLNVIKIEGFANKRNEMLLAKHFLSTATTQCVTLTRPDGRCSWKTLNIPSSSKRVNDVYELF